jgi:hypothetical protein
MLEPCLTLCLGMNFDWGAGLSRTCKVPSLPLCTFVSFVVLAFFSSSTTKDTKVHKGRTSFASTGVGNLTRGSLNYAHGR